MTRGRKREKDETVLYRQGAIYKGGERREGPPSKRNDLKIQT